MCDGARTLKRADEMRVAQALRMRYEHDRALP